MCWFEKNTNLYNREWQIVKENFPKLKFYTIDDKVRVLILRGEIDLKNNGKVFDKYNIEIIFPPDYPNHPPLLRETDERIPRIQDRHINKNDGVCCLAPRIALKEFWDANRNIMLFINGLAIPFLANQSYFEKVGEWRNNSYPHQAEGIIEFYKERTNIVDVDILIVMIEKLINNERVGRNDPCFCRSGKKLKKCHEEAYDRLRNGANKEIFEMDMADIKKYIADKCSITEKSL